LRNRLTHDRCGVESKRLQRQDDQDQRERSGSRNQACSSVNWMTSVFECANAASQ
jgi:hypothetical protein